MADVIWPRRALVGRRADFNFAPRTTAGPANVYGSSQVVASDAGIWRATFDTVLVLQRCDRADGVKLWHAISGLLEGRLNTVLMPVNVHGRRPLTAGVTDDDIEAEIAVPHADDAFFDDGTGYATTFIDVVTASDAARGATTIVLAKDLCGDIEPGMRFSIGERLYQVKRVLSQNASTATITITSRLREEVVTGSRCEFDWPVCLMRLVTDTEMDFEEEPSNYGLPTINLVEAL